MELFQSLVVSWFTNPFFDAKDNPIMISESVFIMNLLLISESS